MNIKSIIKSLTVLVLIGWSTRISAQHSAVLLMNGFLHIGNGETIESGAIGFRNGKIDLIRNALAYTPQLNEWDTIIDLHGMHVYPGFFAPNSTLGLTELDAVRATRDFEEVGEFNPHIRSQIAFNVESDVIKTVLTNGVLFTQATPRGGRISGMSSVMSLHGWNWEDATIQANDGLHINWPAYGSSEEDLKAYRNERLELVEFYKLALSYGMSKDVEHKTDVRLDAMRHIIDGQQRVFFHANKAQELLDVIAFTEQFDIKYPVIVGGSESYKVLQRLKDSHVPVMLTRLHSLPVRDEDPVDLPYKLPYLLQQAGVLFCLQNEGDMEAMHARNIPFLAGTAVAYGLTVEQAVASVSLNTAKILGLDTQFGSLEIGKRASIFVSKGNALDPMSHQVTHIFLDGNQIPVTNRQMELYNNYMKKYKTK